MLRRAVAAGLLGGAAWATVSALAPQSEAPGRRVVVAAGDLPVGSLLSPDLVAIARVPDRLVPGGALTAVDQVDGAVLGGPVRAGEVLTDVRVSPVGSLAGLSGDLVLTHVPVPDAALGSVLRPGLRVDVLSTGDGSVVAGDVLVTAVSAAPAAGSGPGLDLAGAQGHDHGSGFFAAVTAEQAASLATAAGRGLPGGGVTVVLRPNDPAG